MAHFHTLPVHQLCCVFIVLLFYCFIVIVVVFAPKAFRKMVVLTLQTAKKAQNIALENTTAEREPKRHWHSDGLKTGISDLWDNAELCGQ